jgi:hypothetical protein
MMSYELIPRNKRVKSVHINGSIWGVLELAGADVHQDSYSQSDVEAIVNSLNFVLRFVEFCKKSGGFRIE